MIAGGGTGGHLFPGIAVAEAARRRDPMTAILFVGSARGIEARVVPTSGFDLELLPGAPLRGRRVAGKVTALGALVIVGLFALLAIRGLRVALNHPTTFGQLVAFGTTTVLVLQAGINMAVVLGLLPTKGLALPFVSYGGSAMIGAMTAVGVLLALSRESG